MIYDTLNFIYPPRPERKIKPQDIDHYDTGEYYAQPKYNGSAVVVMLDGKQVIVRNRHNEEKTYLPKDIDFGELYLGNGPMVICGELMNKAKKGEYGQPFNNVFVMWDILVLNGRYLVGSTTHERLVYLSGLWNGSKVFADSDGRLKAFDHVLYTGIRGVYKAPYYTKYFAALYENIVKTDAYEGLVFKKANAKLEFGYNENNNTRSHFKVRKQTRNYAF